MNVTKDLFHPIKLELTVTLKIKVRPFVVMMEFHYKHVRVNVLKLHDRNIDHVIIQGPKFLGKLKIIRNLEMLILVHTEQSYSYSDCEDKIKDLLKLYIGF